MVLAMSGGSGMRLQRWLSQFCEMHGRAAQGKLSPGERIEYLAARDELARALLSAQRSLLQPGQTPRRSLRAALALPLTLLLPKGRLSVVTQDISAGGFSTLLAAPPPIGLVVQFSLRLSRKSDPIEAHARLVAIHPTGSGIRAGFAYQDLAPEEIERIELAVFDTVVAQLTAAPESPGGGSRDG
jgi:hypothetical protein